MSQTVGITSLEKLRIHVIRDATDETADEKLIMYGQAMSEEVTDWCEREFLPSPASDDDEPVARAFGYDGEGLLDLAPFDLRSVTSITIEGSPGIDSPQSLSASEYRLNPRGATKQGTYLSLDLAAPGAWRGRSGCHDWTVTITGRWGMAMVPIQAELAVWIAVDDVMKNPGNWASQQLGGYNIVPQALPVDFETSSRGGLPLASIRACRRLKRRRSIGTIRLQHREPLRFTNLP